MVRSLGCGGEVLGSIPVVELTPQVRFVKIFYNWMAIAAYPPPYLPPISTFSIVPPPPSSGTTYFAPGEQQGFCR